MNVLMDSKVENMSIPATVAGYVLFDSELYELGQYSLLEFVVVGKNPITNSTYHVKCTVWGEKRAIPLKNVITKGRSIVVIGNLEIDLKPPSKIRKLPKIQLKITNPQITILSMSVKSQGTQGTEHISKFNEIVVPL